MTVHVAPQQTRPARLASLPKLPIFLDLKGKRTVVVGGNDAAAWKAELLAAAGGRVTVFSVDPCPELQFLSESIEDITVVQRPWRDSDLNDAWIVVAAEDDAERSARLGAAARSRGAFVNVIDQPASCDFQFGTIVNRAPVVIGISTDGGAPILGQAIRRRIEAILPASLGSWALAAKAFRIRLRELLESRAARREFWEQFVNVTFISPAEEDDRLATLERLAQDILARKAPPPTGEVIIVGAGPGDPELLTMRAVRELQAADVILYDSLVTPEVLALGRREARRILVGKRARGNACRQEAISALVVELAQAGHRVVRLKGGDPAVFGRTGEELAACRAADIPVRIVAGIMTASAAAASLGISLTHRDYAQRLQFITAHGKAGGLPAQLDLDALADPNATTVVYMGRGTIGELAYELLARGLSYSTPVAVVSDVSRPAETQTWTNLGMLNEHVSQDSKAPPTLFVIGAAVAPAVMQSASSPIVAAG